MTEGKNKEQEKRSKNRVVVIKSEIKINVRIVQKLLQSR
jgi:hypothetical protein